MRLGYGGIAMKKIFVTGFAAFLAACIASPEEQAAWNEAKSKNTVQAYRMYLAAYPKGVFSNYAIERLETVLSPEEIQELEELGYVTDTTSPASGPIY